MNSANSAKTFIFSFLLFSLTSNLWSKTLVFEGNVDLGKSVDKNFRTFQYNFNQVYRLTVEVKIPDTFNLLNIKAITDEGYNDEYHGGSDPTFYYQASMGSLNVTTTVMKSTGDVNLFTIASPIQNQTFQGSYESPKFPWDLGPINLDGMKAQKADVNFSLKSSADLPIKKSDKNMLAFQVKTIQSIASNVYFSSVLNKVTFDELLIDYVLVNWQIQGPSGQVSAKSVPVILYLSEIK